MADYLLRVKVEATGLDKAVSSLDKFDQICGKATVSCQGLLNVLNELKTVDLGQISDIFKSAFTHCSELVDATGGVVQNVGELNNRLSDTVDITHNISTGAEAVAEEIDNSRRAAAELGDVMTGVNSAFEMGERVYGWTKGLIQGTINARSEMEALERQLSAVMGGAENAKAILPSIKEMANTTVAIDTQGAIKGVSAFMRMGMSAEDAKNKVKDLANATAYFGGDAEQVKNALVQLEQLSSKTSGFGEDIRSLQNSLSGIGGIIREKFGVQEFGELSDKLGLTGKEVVAGIFEELAKLPKVDGGISETFNQIEANITDLKASIGEGFVPALEKVADTVEKVSKAIQNTPTWVKNFASVGAIIVGLGSMFLVAASGASKLFQVFRDGITQLKVLRQKTVEMVSAENLHNQAMRVSSNARLLSGRTIKTLEKEYKSLGVALTDNRIAQANNNVELRKATFDYNNAYQSVKNLEKAQQKLDAEYTKAVLEYNKYGVGLEEAIALDTQLKQVTDELALAKSNLNSIEEYGESHKAKENALKQEEIALTEQLTQKEKELTNVKASRKQKLMNGAMTGLAIGGTMAGSYLSDYSTRLRENGNLTGSAVAGVAGGALMGAGMGAMFGPWGAAIGGVIGAMVALKKAVEENSKVIRERNRDKEIGNINARYAKLEDTPENNRKKAYEIAWASNTMVMKADELRAKPNLTQAHNFEYEGLSRKETREKIWKELEKYSKYSEMDINTKEFREYMKLSEDWKKGVQEFQAMNAQNREMAENIRKQNEEEEKQLSLKEKVQDLQIAANKLIMEGNEFEAQRKIAESELVQIQENEESTEKDIVLAQQKYYMTIQQINEEEKKHTAELEKQAIIQKGQLDSKKAELSGNGKYSNVITAQAEYDAIMRDPNATQHDKEMAGLNLAGAKNSAHISEIREEGALLSAQAEYYGDTKMAKNISAWYEYQSVVQDVTKSNKEKIAEWFKYQSKLMQNEIDEFKKAINEKKKLIDDIIKKREQQTNSVISEIEKERNAMSNYKELGQQAYLTSAYFDTSLVPEQYSRDEIMRANARVDMRKQIDENKKSQVDFALYGNTTNQLKDSQKSIENMEKNISQFNITGQQLLYVMQQVLGGVNNVSGILAYESRKSMA